MTEQKFYGTQPTELPLTLPAGTRINHKDWFAASELTLRNGIYDGQYDGAGDADGRTGLRRGQFWPASILWSSVRLPDSTPDRPIQAGDWVECVNASGRCELTVGERYQVERMFEQSDPRRPQFALCGVESPAFGWCWSRFKRVDGPHPTVVDEGPEPAPLHAGADNGSDESAQALYEPGDPRAHRYCPECGVTVVAGPLVEFPLCAKCVERRTVAKAAPSDPYRAHNFAKQPDKGDIHNRPGNVEARKKLAAWELAGKSLRVNSAERKSLAAGHPASWPSVGDDEP